MTMNINEINNIKEADFAVDFNVHNFISDNSILSYYNRTLNFFFKVGPNWSFILIKCTEQNLHLFGYDEQL